MTLPIPHYNRSLDELNQELDRIARRSRRIDRLMNWVIWLSSVLLTLLVLFG